MVWMSRDRRASRLRDRRYRESRMSQSLAKREKIVIDGFREEFGIRAGLEIVSRNVLIGWTMHVHTSCGGCQRRINVLIIPARSLVERMLHIVHKSQHSHGIYQDSSSIGPIPQVVDRLTLLRAKLPQKITRDNDAKNSHHYRDKNFAKFIFLDNHRQATFT